MKWTIERTELSAVTRRKTQPNYGFIEQAIQGGYAYRILGKGGSGYFIVAPELSLTPGFVVELALPELAVEDRYESLAAHMSERSLGVLWFDSTDRDACDLAWRLGLSIRSGPPLFAWNGLKQDVAMDGFEITTARKADEPRVVELLSAPPLDAGGQTKEATVQNLEGGCVVVLRREKDILGAAVLTPLVGPYVSLSSVVMDTFSELPADSHEKAHRELELLFMNMVAAEVAKKGVVLVYSMARQTPQGFLEAISLRMKVVKQSFMASLNGLPPALSAHLPGGAKAVI
jgi:hypothetical protein